MLNFDLLVKNTLFDQLVEATPPVPAPPSSTDEEKSSKDLIGFLETKRGYLQSLWSEVFPVSLYKFPNKDQLLSDCYNIINSLPRNVKDSKKYPFIEETFPLLDLMATLYNNFYKRGTTLDLTLANQELDNFKTRLKTQKGSSSNFTPIDFNPVNPLIRDIKSHYLLASKNEVGNLRLENLPSTSSFYEIITELLKIREKVYSLKLPKRLRSTMEAAFNSASIEKIFLEPWNFLGGQKYAIDDDKLRILYDDVTVGQLISISVACYGLFQQQINTILTQEQQKILNPKQYYGLFMGTEGATEIQWKTLFRLTEQYNIFSGNSFNLIWERATTSVPPAPSSSAPSPRAGRELQKYAKEVAQRIQGIYKNKKAMAAAMPKFTSILNKYLQINSIPSTDTPPADTPPTNTPPAPPSDVPPIDAPPGDLSPEDSSSSEEKAFVIKTDPTLTYLYTYENLKKASTTFKVDQASQLLSEFQKFANFIQTTTRLDKILNTLKRFDISGFNAGSVQAGGSY